MSKLAYSNQETMDAIAEDDPSPSPWGGRCKKCRGAFTCEEDDDEFGTGLCYHCFEDSVEEAEERRRERIARENEFQA